VWPAAPHLSHEPQPIKAKGCIYWHFVDFINKIYSGIKFCVNCGEDKVTDFVEQRCVRYEHIIDNIMDYITKGPVHAKNNRKHDNSRIVICR
jgi:hypothetical protein